MCSVVSSQRKETGRSSRLYVRMFLFCLDGLIDMAIKPKTLYPKAFGGLGGLPLRVLRTCS